MSEWEEALEAFTDYQHTQWYEDMNVLEQLEIDAIHADLLTQHALDEGGEDGKSE